jgi:hypothetical protein
MVGPRPGDGAGERAGGRRAVRATRRRSKAEWCVWGAPLLPVHATTDWVDGFLCGPVWAQVWYWACSSRTRQKGNERVGPEKKKLEQNFANKTLLMTYVISGIVI